MPERSKSNPQRHQPKKGRATLLFTLLTLFLITNLLVSTTAAATTTSPLDGITLVSTWYEPGTQNESDTTLDSTLMGMAYLRYEMSLPSPDHGLYPFSVQIQVDSVAKSGQGVVSLTDEEEKSTGKLQPGVVVSTQASPFFSNGPHIKLPFQSTRDGSVPSPPSPFRPNCFLSIVNPNIVIGKGVVCEFEK
jgi:hypothetical protein